MKSLGNTKKLMKFLREELLFDYITEENCLELIKLINDQKSRKIKYQKFVKSYHRNLGSYDKVSDELGYSKQWVHKILNSLGFKPNYSTKNTYISELRYLQKHGTSISKMKEVTGLSEIAIKFYLNIKD